MSGGDWTLHLVHQNVSGREVPTVAPVGHGSGGLRLTKVNS